MSMSRLYDWPVVRSVIAITFAVSLMLPGLATAVPNPSVTGPVPVTVSLGDPSRDYPQLATQLDLESKGYVEEEYFFQGEARRYSTPDLATGGVISDGHGYRTRMVVRRPVSPQRFNGTVIVDWLNVTSGYNLDAMWLTSRDHILREGYAYVGVSVQRVGVHAEGTGLRSWSPIRYGDLDVTDGGSILDDSLSYDIYSQAAQSIRSPQGVNPLGPLVAERLIATGASQSQGFLVRYHNSVHPLANVYDGYLLYIGIGGILRTDLEPKVIKVYSENDVLFLGQAMARQPESDRLRSYEVAGTSHVSFDPANLRGELLVRDGLPVADTTSCDLPALSRIPLSHVVNASWDHLVRWIEQETEPPTAEPLRLLSTSPVIVERDGFGNALGGVQLPQHAVPTATNTGANSGPGFCFLFGSHQPLDDSTLRQLYRNHGQYVSAFQRANREARQAGYIVTADYQNNIREAARSDVGKR
ncbi:MAG: hypothetical protein LAT50_14160 [Ectothiorhodospiraceae bacterium]|nr:hypothetical protein [Ectothiorhodospiraceae bacterium]